MKKYELFKNSIVEAVPELYDRIENTINFGYTEESVASEQDEERVVYKGYSVPILHIDYGSIKSNIIEHVYPKKDEFALLNNALMALLKERQGITYEDDPSIEEDIQAFIEFGEWRDIAAQAAKALMNSFK